MDTLIVQLGVKHGRVAELARSNGDRLSVGRGLENSVVLTDPYVAPQQVRFCRNDSQWAVEVLDQTNPVLLNGEPVRGDNASISSGDRLTIGRTHLTLFSADHTVEPTRKLLLSSWLHHDSVGLWVPCLVLLLVSVLDAFMDYVQSSTTLEWQQYGNAALYAAIIIGIWSGIWSIAGRLLRHQHHFGSQLLLSSLVCGALIFLYPLAGYLEFLSSSHVVGEIVGYIVGFLVLASLLKFNLFFATNIERSSLVSGVLSAALIGLVYLTVSFEWEDFDTRPEYSKVLKPPFARLAGVESVEGFWRGVEGEVDLLDGE